jgi:hypothetical protein
MIFLPVFVWTNFPNSTIIISLCYSDKIIFYS